MESNKEWKLKNKDRVKKHAETYRTRNPLQHKNIAPIKNSLYRGMRRRSITRGHDFSLTQDEFYRFLEMTDFQDIYDRWREAGFPRKEAPSVDRINEIGNYTLDNIQIITVGENVGKRGKWISEIIKSL